jgi:hypothetical protein
LNFEGDIPRLATEIAQCRPDILGLSVNFGELDSFRTLVSLLSDVQAARPIICVGNVLAAWASAEIASICAGYDLVISRSYGEKVLEDVCLAFARRAQDPIELKPTHDILVERCLPVHPPAIVSPDEQLLADTIRQSGQPAIETSFGCQYGRCSFCPRDHRSNGWRRPAPEDAVAVIGTIASQLAAVENGRCGVLSIVDEDAFGDEGLDPECKQPWIIELVGAASNHQVACEIYTRAEQIFNYRWKRDQSIIRLQQLAKIRPWLRRVFVGIESGSNTQLRRYSKGQGIKDIIYALRAGSLLDLPLEFGFITFDPLLSERELVENLEFLARTDVLLSPIAAMTMEDVYSAVTTENAVACTDAVFTRVAYMATELELFASSPLARKLKSSHPELIGEYDSSFARYRYSYADPRIGHIAAWCRVWTEGTFKPIYRMRLSSRTVGGRANPYQQVIRRHREATFALLLALAARLSPSFATRVVRLSAIVDSRMVLGLNDGEIHFDHLRDLWRCVVSNCDVVQFDEGEFTPERLERRRDA